jgi:gluconokinase
MPNITYQPYALLYLKENGLDLRERKFFASQGGYNFFKLTGERLETKSILSGMGFLDTHRLVCDPVVMELCGILPEQFGVLADYRDVRPLLPKMAESLGAAPGIPVVPAHSDGALNQIGNGCTRHGQMTFSVGTSAAIRLSTDRPVLSDPPGTWCYVGAGEKGWLSGAATNGACNCIDWFRETVLKGKWSFEELNEELLSDAHTPAFVPFLFGERCPGWEDTRRGTFYDLNGQDDAPALFRAICEEVLFNIFQCCRILVRLAGEPKRIVLSGGILHSEKWIQMAADVFQREMEVSEALHASLLGGAALALTAAGSLKKPEDFVCGQGPEKVVSPRPEAAKKYEDRFERFYFNSRRAGRYFRSLFCTSSNSLGLPR